MSIFLYLVISFAALSFSSSSEMLRNKPKPEPGQNGCMINATVIQPCARSFAIELQDFLNKTSCITAFNESFQNVCLARGQCNPGCAKNCLNQICKLLKSIGPVLLTPTFALIPTLEIIIFNSNCCLSRCSIT